MHLLRCICAKMHLGPGFRHKPRWGAYSAPSRPIAGFKGAASRRRDERKREGTRKGRKKEGRKRWKRIPPPRIFVFMALRRSKNLNNSYTSRGALWPLAAGSGTHCIFYSDFSIQNRSRAQLQGYNAETVSLAPRCVGIDDHTLVL